MIESSGRTDIWRNTGHKTGFFGHQANAGLPIAQTLLDFLSARQI